MQRLNLYLFQQLLYAFLFAVVGVSLVVLFAQSFRLLSFVIDNSGSLLIFIQLIGLMIPTFLPLVIPLALGVAVIFIYHKFAIDSEIVVMRAAGISPLRLITPALTLAALVTAFAYLLTTWATPAASRELVALQYKVRDNYSVFFIKSGVFNDLAEGLTFYVRSRDKEGRLQDLLIHDVRNPQKPTTIMADAGQFTNENNEPRILIYKGKRQEIDPQTGRLSQLIFDRYVLDLQVLRNGMAGRLPDPREQSMQELMNPPADPALRRRPLEHTYSELHQRLANPLLVLSYTLIGVTAILAGEFNRRGMMQRILVAAITIIAVQAASLSAGSIVSRNIWLIPLLYVVPLLPIPICMAILFTPPWWKKFLRYSGMAVPAS